MFLSILLRGDHWVPKHSAGARFKPSPNNLRQTHAFPCGHTLSYVQARVAEAGQRGGQEGDTSTGLGKDVLWPTCASSRKVGHWQDRPCAAPCHQALDRGRWSCWPRSTWYELNRKIWRGKSVLAKSSILASIFWFMIHMEHVLKLNLVFSQVVFSLSQLSCNSLRGGM